MSADSPRRGARGVPAIVPPQVVSDRSIIDSVAGFINDVTLAHQPQCDPKDTITWARFETAADISDSRFGDDWELEGNVAPPLLLILGYGQGVQVWAIPANGEAVEVLSWRHGIVSALRVLPTPSYAENGRADEPVDAYADKRPLMAICDGTTPAGSNPQFCAVNFHSLKTNTQVKTIKFKNPVLDILANRSSIVITFHERIAVFDARSLDDRLSVTTCFPSPGINPNPVALGSRWMAYSENKLLHSKRSGGGCDGDGVSSYTATVLNAAKSFGKGLRELGEQVAAGLTGTTGSGMSSKSSSFDSATGDVRQPGVVTILDIKHPIKDVSPTSGTPVSINGSDPIVAHFIAHSEAVVAMEFDNSGMMLLTADRRGHDFHLFRIQPHPVGSSLAAVHHLYVLHRGDTSAKVQNITFSLDSRWVAVSTLRGTTHVFPVTPYGGPAGVRTHTSLHVVNKLSRFHRSAGLTADGRSSSPISHSDSTNFCQTLMPYHNPTLPPFPRPTVVLPLAQLRQPFTLGSPPGSAAPSSYSKASNTRQRLSSLSDDNGKPLSVCAVFAKSRSWLLDPPIAAREAPHKIQRKAVDSLFVMAGHGALIQYDLDTKLATNVAKEKICDDTPIELEVEARAQWNLGRKEGSLEIVPPLSSDNWLIKDRNSCMLIDSSRQFDENDDRGDSWLSQVEIITHAGPHRRLWMGPQFVFKTYNTPSGSNLSHIDVEAVEIGVSSGPSATCRPERSSPLNMPLSATGRSTVPVLIESGSYSSIEQSPKLMDRFRHEHMNSDFSVAHGDTRLREDLADAMRESPSVSHKDTGGRFQRRRPSAAGGGSSRPTASSSPSSSQKARSGGSGGVCSTSASSSSSAGTLVGGAGVANSSPSATASPYSSQYESLESSLVQQEHQQHMKSISIEKVVNPLGTVTTITGSYDSDLDLDDVLNRVNTQDYVIHENCDESLFRPVVAIFCDESSQMEVDRLQEDNEYTKPPEAIGNKLVVPVIEKSVDLELTKKESLKNRGRRQQQQQTHFVREEKVESDNEVIKFHLAEVSKKSKGDRRKPLGDKQSIRSEDQQAEFTSKQSLNKESKSIVMEEISKTEDTNPKLKISKEPKKEASKEKHSEKKFKPPTSSKTCRSLEPDVLSDSELASKKSSDSTKKVDLKPKLLKTRESVEKDSLSDVSLVKSDETTEPSNELAPIRKPTKNRKSEEKDNVPVDLLPKKKEPPEEETTVTISLRIPKSQKSKGPAEEETPKPLKTDDFEEEKPIEFKRMTMTPSTATASSSKTSNKGVKIDKIVPKVEGKFQIKSERKSKLQKGSSGESSESTELATRPAKSLSKVIKEKSKSPDKDEIGGKSITKKISDAESKRKTNDVVRAPKSSSSLAIELSNVSDLADSMLDFLPEKSEEEMTPTVCVDKLKKATDDEPIADVPKVSCVSIEPDADKTKACELDETYKKDTKKIESKLSNERKCTKPSSPPTVEPDKKLEHIEPVSDVSKKDTIIVVEDKSSEESESSASVKNLVEICPNPSEAKFKERKKKSKATVEKSKRQEEAEKHKETPLPDPKESYFVEFYLSESKSPAPYLVEDRISTPNTTEEVAEEHDLKSDKKLKKDKNNEMTASQVTIEPMKEETFLSDLMDSQMATKSKISPTKETKSEESSKKSLESPLKFVDTYVDSFVKPTTPLKKENSKKKQSPCVGEVTSEVSLSDRLKSPAGIEFFDKFAKDSVESITPWKPIVVDQANPIDNDYPTLGKSIKGKKSQSPPAEKKPKAITFTIDFSEPQCTKNKKQVPKTSEDLPSPQPLEDLPPIEYLAPLPPLEPWEGAADENVSLINFESPLQETSKPIRSDPEVEKSSPQFPKGFPADTIIFALCGSLHYENENSGKLVDSPLTLSYSDSTAHTTAEYKSLTENDDQYLSLEQSSQENAPSTSSSTCEDVTEAAYSSGGGEKVPIVVGKTKYKQRKKLLTAAPDDDEELRPLINKNDDVNNASCNTPASKGKSSVKATAIMKKESLPSLDNNQVNSDSSSSDQATTTSEDPDDQICLNVHASGVGSLLAPGRNQINQQHHNTEGGTQSIDHIDGGDLSSSSLSSGSRASLGPPSSSPTMSITGDNLMHFPADSSGSL